MANKSYIANKIEYFITDTVGYKKLRDGKIAVLLISSKNNLERKNVIDKDFAKFRCAAAFVKEIYDAKDRSKTYKSGESFMKSDFVYKVGKVVTCEQKDSCNFNQILEDVCTNGIHFFLTELAAKRFYYSVDEKWTGTFYTYRDDGSLECVLTFEDGTVYGTGINYDEKGKFSSFYEYGPPTRRRKAVIDEKESEEHTQKKIKVSS